MKVLTRLVATAVIATVVTGCYTRKERIVERERDRPVVRERIVETPSSSTTIQTPDTSIKVK
ncbi:MAG TPA: hypothetical protein VNT99_00960 [Methylomirabilota bacterium]|nr:hypothetical protein [Methylomirabilota bacterium]